MCLSIPGKVLSIKGKMAEIDIAGNIYEAGMHLTEDISVGDNVLIHSGFIIQKLSREEAEETKKLLRELLDSQENSDKP